MSVIICQVVFHERGVEVMSATIVESRGDDSLKLKLDMTKSADE